MIDIKANKWFDSYFDNTPKLKTVNWIEIPNENKKGIIIITNEFGKIIYLGYDDIRSILKKYIKVNNAIYYTFCILDGYKPEDVINFLKHEMYLGNLISQNKITFPLPSSYHLTNEYKLFRKIECEFQSIIQIIRSYIENHFYDKFLGCSKLNSEKQEIFLAIDREVNDEFESFIDTIENVEILQSSKNEFIISLEDSNDRFGGLDQQK